MPRKPSDITRYIPAKEVANYLCISRGMVDVLVSRGKLPAPIELSPRLKRWDIQAIDAAVSGNPELVTRDMTIEETTQRIVDGITAQAALTRQKTHST